MKKFLHKGLLIPLCLCILCLLTGFTLLLYSGARPSPALQYHLQGSTLSALENGHLLWKRQLPEVDRQFPSSLLAHGSVLSVATGPVYAFDERNGALVWQRSIRYVDAFSTSSQVADALSWDHGQLFAETTYNHIVALDPSNGALGWEYAAQDGLISPAAFSTTGKRVYVETMQLADQAYYSVQALSEQDGTQLWQQMFRLPYHGEQHLARPTLSHGVISAPMGGKQATLQEDGTVIKTP
jgi:outer membrane protein assembly factor BamB